MPYVHGDLSRSRNGKRSGKKYTADPIQFHLCFLPSLLSVDEAETSFQVGGLGCGILLAGHFYPHENSKSHQYQSAYRHPLGRHVH